MIVIDICQSWDFTQQDQKHEESSESRILYNNGLAYNPFFCDEAHTLKSVIRREME